MSGEEGQTELQQQLLSALSFLKDVLLGDPNNRAEAKTWLISTIAHLQNVPAEVKLACFHPFSNYDNSSNRSSLHSRRRSRSRDRHGNREYHEDTSRYRSFDSSRRSMPAGQLIPDRRHSSRDNSNQQHPLESCKPAILQLLQLLIDSQPQAVSQLLTQNSNFLRDYLTSSPATATSWFGHFSVSGIQHFQHGARALANYALTNRSEVWQHLVWSGKHDQAPVAVAAKPHYFAELDVPATVRNLARYCPRFWSSDELLKSCEGGYWLKLDSDLVQQELYYLLYDDHSPEQHQLLQLLRSHIQSADWQLLCNRLLLLLTDQQLSAFIRLLAQQQQQQQHQQQSTHTSSRQQKNQSSLFQQWLSNQAAYSDRVSKHTVAGSADDSTAAAAAAAVPASQLPCVDGLPLLVLDAATQQCSLDDLLLCDAVTCHRSQLLSLFRQSDDDDDGMAVQLLELVSLAESVAVQQQDIIAAAAAGDDDKGKQRLLLLVSGWLIRLHLLLCCAQGVEILQQTLQQQQSAAGWRVLVLSTEHQWQQEAAAAMQHQPREQQQQQDDCTPAVQQQQQGPGSEQLLHVTQQSATDEQQKHSPAAEVRKALKRGLPKATQGHKESRKKHKVKTKHKHAKEQHKKNRKRRQRGSSSSSNSDSEPSDSQNCDKYKAKKTSKKRRHSRHSKRNKRSRRHSNDSSSSSSSGDGESSCDYDAGGKLLNPADFKKLGNLTSTAARSHITAKSTAAAAEGALEKAVSQLTAEQQQQLARIVDALDSFNIGGRLWSGLQFLLRLAHCSKSTAKAATTAEHSSSEAHSHWLSGSSVDVVDAAAWYSLWLCCNSSHS